MIVEVEVPVAEPCLDGAHVPASPIVDNGVVELDCVENLCAGAEEP